MFGLFKKSGPKKASINSGQHEVTVEPNQNLLDAALKSGVNFPHDCRVGSCGSCTCKLTKGKIKKLTDFSYVLTLDQLNDGMILACQSRLKTDVNIEVNIDESAKKTPVESFTGKVKSKKLLTYDIVELTIELENLNHNGLAGQYAEVFVDTVGSARSYSFAKAPKNELENELTFYIRKVPEGKFTGWLFDSDCVGQKITINTPFGSFYYRDKSSPMICIAGGSGMSAVKAILEQAAIDQVKRNALFLFGARTQKDLYGQEEMNKIKEAWNPDYSFEFANVLNMEPEDSDWNGPRGMVTEHLKLGYVDTGKINISECQGYLCGPPPMIDAAIEVLTNEGMDENEIFFDKFLDSGSK